MKDVTAERLSHLVSSMAKSQAQAAAAILDGQELGQLVDEDDVIQTIRRCAERIRVLEGMQRMISPNNIFVIKRNDAFYNANSRTWGDLEEASVFTSARDAAIKAPVGAGFYQIKEICVPEAQESSRKAA